MSCNEWKTVKLGDVADVLSGYAFKTKDFIEEGVPVVKIKNIIPPNIDINDTQYVSNEMYEEKIKYALNYNDILISMTGSNVNQIASAVGKIGRVKLKYTKLLLNQRVGKLFVKDNSKCNYDYLYYYLIQPEIRYNLAANAGGSANQANISPADIKNIDIKLPSLEEQEKIVNILSCLDDKIELNNEMNKTLEEMAQSIFKRWFVDFEFPNEDGQPYKSSGGEMVESELGMIPKGWEVGSFSDISEILDSKRIPLSKREREKRANIYPYYGAASLMDYVDDYIFEGIHVLMGEDGTVIDKDGFPILQYVGGKFWVNNHAHVLKGKNEFSNEFVYLYLSNTNVTHLVTGAVQPKINQKNLTSLKLPIPDKNMTVKFNSLAKNIFEYIYEIRQENKKLEEIRSILLPVLMNGTINIK